MSATTQSALLSGSPHRQLLQTHKAQHRLHRRLQQYRMSVHPQAQVLLDLMAQRPQVQPTDLPVVEYRAYIEKLSRPRTVPEVAEVKDIRLPGAAGPMRARIYNPTPNASAPQPALIYIHGGGWCLSSVESHDSICRALASQANIVVLSLDYRLAPEHVFPAGLEDCYAATQWISKHANELNLDPARLALGGDSAGGNLTAATLLLTHERKGAPIAFQLLLYPAVHTLASNQSRQQFAEGFALDKTLSNWMFQSYVGSDNKTALTDPRVSPLLAKDLSFMPPAFVLTASHDPLRDEGKAYAERLQQEGIKCLYKCYEGMLHGFLNHTYLLPLDVGEQAISECARHLRDALQTSNGKL